MQLNLTKILNCYNRILDDSISDTSKISDYKLISTIVPKYLHLKHSELLIPFSKINSASLSLAQQIIHKFSSDYININLICILNGAIPFFEQFRTDLYSESSDINQSISVSYIKVNSYKGLSHSDYVPIEVVQFENPPLKTNKDTLHIIVDDIYDSGFTMSLVRDYIKKEYNIPDSDIIECCLLKKEDVNNQCKSKHLLYGVSIPNVWVYGFGLDLFNNYRDLKEVRYIKSDKQNK